MKLLLPLLITINIFAQETITLNWLEKQPKSIAKDFYIYRYLNQDISPEQSLKAIEQVRYLNNKIFYRFANKSDDDSFKKLKSCMRMKTSSLIKKEDYCIQSGLTVYEATKLSKNNLEQVIDKIENNYPKLKKKLDILNSAIPFKSLEQSTPDTFFNTFNECGGVYRAKYFNNYFPLNLIKELKPHKQFAQTVKLIVTNKNMKKAQASLLHVNPEGLDFKTTFHLAINAIVNKKDDIATVYLEDAYKKAYYQMQKDNITFWQYKLTNDKKYLKKLASSWDINLYSLYASEILNKKQTNIIFEIKQKSSNKKSFDIDDPFKWLKVLNESKKMDDKKLLKYQDLFNSFETIGHLAFVKERYDRYRNSYFITPYNKYIGDYKQSRQALIYAIARQESRFIPTSISSAYAMGTMQIMPFLSKAIAKELKDKYDIDKQLKPKTNLRYANHHLNFLEKRLKHPLLIAYGYNGGIGFTNRILKQGLFKKGEYEPFLSMELLPYDETKKYGKKVLANYYVYQNHLNKNNKIKLSTLFQKIQNPYQH
ncbi:MAG: lytic transglycosylase domain-containing protein [Campylobacterota bacterium]|nr:lytic transglycosylase domain-containing protein [Campylobacterota bacterium]